MTGKNKTGRDCKICWFAKFEDNCLSPEG